MNLLADGASWMFAALKESASATVTLRRTGQSDTTGVKAVVGSSQAVSEEAGQTVVDSRSVDFLIAVADYTFASAAVEPVLNDVIIKDGVLFEVVPFANEPCWRFTDEHNRTTMRIHTMQKS